MISFKINHQEDKSVSLWLGHIFESLTKLLPVLGILFTLIITFWSITLILRVPYIGLDWSYQTGKVIDIAPGGPASEQILQDDIILAFDNIPTFQARGLPGYSPGDMVWVRLKRGENEISRQITLDSSPLHLILLRFAIIVIAISFWLLGLLVFLKSKYSKITSIFFLFCELFASALSLGSISAYGPRWFSTIFNAILWWIGPLLIQTHALLMGYGENSFISKLSKFCYWIAALFCLLNITNLLSSENHLTHIIQYVWLGITLSLAILIIINASYQNTSTITKKNIHILGVSAIIAILPFVIFSMLPEICFHKLLLPYEVSLLSLPILPLGYSYTILNKQLIHIEQYINRNATNALSFIITVVLYTSLYFGMFKFFSNSTLIEQLLLFGINLILIYFVQPLHQFLQRKLEKLFYGGWYDNQNAAQQISQALVQVSGNTQSIAQTLCYTLQKTLQLEYVNLVLSDGSLISTASKETINVNPDKTNRGEPLLLLFKSIILSKQLAGTGSNLRKSITLPEKKRNEIIGENPHYWILLAGKQSNQGLLILGARYGGGTYNPHDLEIMEIVLHQAGVALENAHLLEEVQIRNKQIRTLHHQLINTREEERKRISRDLHDKIIQTLVSMNFQISTARTKTSQRMNTQLTEIQNELRNSIKDLRLICADLRPPTLDALGLVPAIQTRVEELQNQISADITLELTGLDNIDLPESVTICIYRFLQEALLNIQKHARAKAVNISFYVTLDKKEIHCITQDDGIGFVPPKDLATLSHQHHFGIIGLQEQIEAVGGCLVLESNLNAGCQLEAIIPISEPTNRIINE